MVNKQSPVDLIEKGRKLFVSGFFKDYFFGDYIEFVEKQEKK